MKPLLVPGGRAFVWPAVQRVQRISLNTMTLQVESPTVYTSQGVPISVTGIAQVKIQGQNEDMLLVSLIGTQKVLITQLTYFIDRLRTISRKERVGNSAHCLSDIRRTPTSHHGINDC